MLPFHLSREVMDNLKQLHHDFNMPVGRGIFPDSGNELKRPLKWWVHREQLSTMGWGKSSIILGVLILVDDFPMAWNSMPSCYIPGPIGSIGYIIGQNHPSLFLSNHFLMASRNLFYGWFLNFLIVEIPTWVVKNHKFASCCFDHSRDNPQIGTYDLWKICIM